MKTTLQSFVEFLKSILLVWSIGLYLRFITVLVFQL